MAKARDSDRRVRRSAEFDDLLVELSGSRDKIFPTMRDALLFAGCLGFSRNQRVPLGRKQSEPIRWDIMTNRPGTETAVNLIAVLTNEDDPEILSEERFEERIQIFEEFANGGFKILSELLSSSTQPASKILLALVNENIPSEGSGQTSDITDAIF